MVASAHDSLEALLALRALPKRRIVGLMSGTSADAIDAAVVEVSGSGEGIRCKLLHSESLELPRPLKRRIWSLPDGPSANICELNFLLGKAFGEAALRVISSAGMTRGDVHLIGSHGQTARHQPPGTMGVAPSTLQIGEGAMIAEQTGLPVICDFRVADVAAGGHGAPLIPLVDYLLFRDENEVRVLLNLGGIANITVVRPERSGLIAFDTGPANMAIDTVARAASDGHESFDRDGKLSRSGEVDRALLGRLMAHPFFDREPPKSTGREMFGRDFVYPLLDEYGERLADLAATLTALTIESIAHALRRFVLPRHPVARLYVSGGGVHNPALMEGLARALSPIPVASLAHAGVDPDAKEALGFAVLANETLFCNAGNITSATGARGPRVLGKIVLPPLP